MGRYIIKRLIITIPTVLIISIAIFTLLYFTPGDPARMILGESASEAELQEYRAYLGIDRPYFVQLGDYLYKTFIKLDFGKSWYFRTEISEDIMERLPRSFIISMYSLIIGAISGIPLGILAATHQGGVVDKIVLFLSSILHCVPNYVIAFLLIIGFGLHLRWFPIYGIGTPAHYVLPCAAIFFGSFANLSRSMRTSMLEVIRSDFILSAKAQGYSKKNINYIQALPNAMIPIATQLGTQFANALGGTMILETIFTVPGMGLYLQNAIANRDVPIVTAIVIIMAIWFCLVMLFVDLVYGFIDPRIKAQYEAQGKKRRQRKNYKRKAARV